MTRSQLSDEARAARLLAHGRTPPRRAVDLLLEDLAAHDGGRLGELLSSGPVAFLGPPLDSLAGGRASLAELREAKRRCNAARSDSLRAQLEALAGYFTVLAAALLHERVRITSHPREELESILLDLAAATGEPWSELFARASSAARR